MRVACHIRTSRSCDPVRGNCGCSGRAIRIWNLIAAPPTEIHTINERVMANVIEFYVPKSFRNPFLHPSELQLGKLIEFCSRQRILTRPAGVLGWLLAAKESNHAVGSE
jgi:hypothetical protein